MSQINPFEPSQSSLEGSAGIQRQQYLTLAPISSLATALKVLYWLHVVASLFGVGITLFQMTIPQSEFDSPNPTTRVLIFVGVSLIFALGFLFLLLTTVILHCIWTHRASRNAEVLGAIGKQYSPAWSVGWFFIPFANLVMPYKVAVEIYLASKPGPTGTEWKTKGAPPFLGWWWGCWLISAFLSQLSFRLTMSGGPDLEAIANYLGIIAEVPGLIAIFMVMKFISSVVERQQETVKALHGPQADSTNL